VLIAVATAILAAPRPALAQPPAQAAPAQAVERGEASLILPDMGQVSFNGRQWTDTAHGRAVVCALGLLFGLIVFTQLKNMPVHSSMLEVSELITRHARPISSRKASSS
jgi:K(+)-stimulated pyrophosphate-energized sodium pump